MADGSDHPMGRDGSDHPAVADVPLTLAEYERLRYVAALQHPIGDVLFETPNRACLWRVETFYKKEPDTVAWIDTFAPGDVFVDIGANVGMYAIWAAKTTGVRVYAFEPEAQNFALINRNIALNKTDVCVYPIALSDETRVAPLYLSAVQAGGSCHSFGESLNFKGEQMQARAQHGAVSMRLDDLVDDGTIPQPDYIKIDVDGIEDRVVRGAERCMRHAQSVLIEINPQLHGHRWVMEAMDAWGFKIDTAEIERARRTEGAFRGIGNVIFRKATT